MKIYGNKQALDRLSEYFASDRFPHALLFFGDSGTGKKALADYTAMQLLCSEKKSVPCMNCQNCKRIEQHIHPDVIYSHCSGLSIDDMRGVLKTAFEKPLEGQIKIFVFYEFQLLEQKTQNVALTFLEEPLPSVKFILTASNRNGILPTILSRVAALQTQKLTESECCEALAEQGIENSRQLAQTYGGNLGMAIKAAEDKNSVEYLERAKEFCGYIIDKNEYKAINLLLHLPQPKENKREPLRILVTETEKIFHDGFVISAGGKGGCGCCKELSQRLAQSFSIQVLNKICDEAVKFSKSVTENNFNAKITSYAFVSAIFSAFCLDK